MHLAPEATLTFPTHGTAHFYTENGAALSFDGLDHSTEQWLQNLATGDQRIEPPDEARSIIASLHDAGVLTLGSVSHHLTTPGSLASDSAPAPPDILAHRGNPDPALKRKRQRAVIAVRGVTPLTVAILAECRTLGVEQFIIDDPRPPLNAESLSKIFPPQLSRAAGAAQFLRQEHRATIRGENTPADITLVQAGQDIDMLSAAVLWAQGLTHIPVRETDRGVTIGPLIIPGVTGCLDCCVQSLGGNITHDAGLHDDATDAALSVTTSRIACAITAHDVVSYLDGLQPATTHHVVHVFNASRRVVEVPWSAQESCWCQGDTPL
ncbi:hypothetical protein [Jonesia quinghaiensis]|uniref:hypothetical protein n=1 Tax=Jonesia quinghaiensis TaxID=262806 RepID=UPI000415CA95|nr:hypothetical protein [Jonesia quinghaiensis]